MTPTQYNEMSTKSGVESIETTLGELVELLTKIALETGSSKQEAYAIASHALADLLSKRTQDHKSA